MMHVHKHRLCNKCEELKPPEGGVEMTKTRWICGGCWLNRATKPKQYKVKEETNDNRD